MNIYLSLSLSRYQESRKNLERKLCLRLYSIRLLEFRAHSQTNKASLLETLAHLLKTTTQLCDLIKKINQREGEIRLHEQSKIYLDESLTLHGEISSKSNRSPGQVHPVYSLHERYARHVHLAEAMARVCAALDQKIEAYESRAKSHANAIMFIKS